MTRSTPTCGSLASAIVAWRHRGLALLSGCLLAGTPAAALELAQPPTYYAPCTPAALAGFPWTHPAFGHRLPGIALRNITLHPCRVAGFPGLVAYDSTGRAGVRIERQMFADTKVYAYTVDPGSAVFFALYGHPPHGEFDRSCVGIVRIDVVLRKGERPIPVTLATGTCGGRLTTSQIFPVAELAR